MLEKWFDKLVKNKMAGAALPVSGIALGMVLLQYSRTIKEPFDWYVSLIGILLMSFSSVMFATAMIIYLFSIKR